MTSYNGTCRGGASMDIPMIENAFIHSRWLISLFQKSFDNSNSERIRAPEEDGIGSFSRIRCPACGWHPKAASRWSCYDPEFSEHPFGGCETEWNTFDTRGKCPGCAHQWIHTTCLRCETHSLHENWYETVEE